MAENWSVRFALAVVLMALLPVACADRSQPAFVSEFGKYEGYPGNVYDGWKRTSDFLTMADGTRLAYDLFLPANKSVPSSTPLPVLFIYTPYDRAWTVIDTDGKVVLCDIFPVWWCEPGLRLRALLTPLLDPQANGRIQDALARTEWLVEMVKSGYAVIAVDRPGTGASFGRLDLDARVVASEADQILDWIAAQSWCDGNIGMFGDSIQAQIQFQAASSGNPHLKAILPATTWIDNYSAVAYPGGIPNLAFGRFYEKVNETFERMATPVDRDTDGSLLAQARLERQNASALAQEVNESTPYRDRLLANGVDKWTRYHALYPLLEEINNSGTPVYLIGGWYDLYARDDFLIYENLKVPKRLLFRPTDHAGIESPGSDIDIGAEAHRWFDYWLKGIDNGIMDEPPIHYYLQGAEKGKQWQAAFEWPLPHGTWRRFYFASPQAGSPVSVNSGTVAPLAPIDSTAFDAYQPDYSPTTGTAPLWSAGATSHRYPDMRIHDSKSLTYTTPAFERPVQVSGHPIARIWLTAAVPDLDLFVYLEQVDAKGNSTYITEGQLRASHRALAEAPFDTFGLPWRNHFESEVQPIPADQPIELVFALRPTAWQFPPGSHIRITVSFTDAGNFDTPIVTPAPHVRILRDASHPSSVELPLVEELTPG